jgi:RNA polymerase sigma-70 factor (ECF subfamily)
MEENDGAEDWDLARRAAAGDEQAYACLIERHQGPIHGFIFRSVGEEETARDLTQEVFVKAWFALGRVRERARFTTWLFQIAANLCRDHAKSKASRQARITHSLVREMDDGPGKERDFSHPGLSPDRQAQTHETMEALNRAIRSLPVDLREAFILGAIDQLPHKEISIILGLSPKAVEVRIYRARKILFERLAGEGIVGPASKA